VRGLGEKTRFHSLQMEGREGESLRSPLNERTAGYRNGILKNGEAEKGGGETSGTEGVR